MKTKDNAIVFVMSGPNKSGIVDCSLKKKNGSYMSCEQKISNLVLENSADRSLIQFLNKLR